MNKGDELLDRENWLDQSFDSFPFAVVFAFVKFTLGL